MAPLALWCSGERAHGGDLGKGGQGERGGLGTLPEGAVLTWALPRGVKSGGVNNAAVLPKGHFLQTPSEALPVTTHPPIIHRKKGPQTASKGRKQQGQEANPGWPSSKPTLSTTSPELSLPARAVCAEASENGKEVFQAWELQGGGAG